MKVTLITNFDGLMTYKNGYSVFEACGKYAGRKSDFVYEIQVDVEEIQRKSNSVGHVFVQKRQND